MLRPKKSSGHTNQNSNYAHHNKYARYSVSDDLRPCRNRYGKLTISNKNLPAEREKEKMASHLAYGMMTCVSISSR